MYRKLLCEPSFYLLLLCHISLSNVGVPVRNQNVSTSKKKKKMKETKSFTLIKRSQYLVVNSESYVDRSSRRASRAAWKQSQCVASGQAGGGGFGSASASPIPPVGQQPAPASATAAASAATSTSAGPSGIILPVSGDGVIGGGAYLPFGNQQSINNLLTTRSASALSHSQQSTVSISSGSVSSIPSSLATSGPTGNNANRTQSGKHSNTH